MMNVKPRSVSGAANVDEGSEYALYAEVAEVVSKALQAGREPDLEQLISQHPEHAEHIDQLVSTLTMLHEVDQWRGGESTDGSSAPDPRAALGCIGDYRLIREVGRGGMGVVYEAEQLSLSRKVALKVLPFAAVLDQRQLQRFKNEAQAAAQLHHTHIVPVFGVGCERGVHYYAMQYIEGLTLREVITELRRSSGLPGDVGAASTLSRAAKPPISNGLLDVREPAKAASSNAARLGGSAPVGAGSSAAVAALASEQSTRSPAFFRAVAKLAKDAAEALEHAHEVGVVHRDIKPGNLIVDSRGHVWVTDFGLARVESDPGLTMTGDIVGTVRYMSPEQALAKRVPIDHRTDIYSLGATLYELLTLQPVFAGKDRQELLRQIAFDEPRSPRKINPFIPRELETIVLTAIRKNPVERYESARTLADDLERFLEYKPILAKPPSLADRASKWCRRHTTAVGSMAALLVTAVVALSISTALIWREKDRTQNALTQARDNFSLAETQRERAEANFLLARESVDQMLTRVANQLKDQPHTEQLRRELLEDALAFYERFLANENSSPDVRHDTGNALRRVASINSWLGDRTKAEAAYHRSVDTLEKLVEEYPDQPEYRSSLATSYQYLGNFVAGSDKYEEAASLCRNALGIAEQLVESYPETAEYRSQLAGLLNDMGIRLSEMDEDQDAERHYRRSLALWEALASEFPAEAEYREELARIHNNLGVLLGNKGDSPGKEQEYREAIAIMDELIADDPTEPGYRSSQALYLNNLVHTLRNRGQLDEAEETFPQALELYQDLATDFPKAPGYRSWVRKVQLQWAPALIDAGRREDALAAYRKAAHVEESLIEDFPSQTQYRVSLIVIYRCIAEVLANGQEYDEAQKVAQDAVDMARELVAAHSDENKYREQLADSQLTLASVLKKSGDHDAAEAAYQQALTAVVDLIDRDPDEPRYRSVQWYCFRLIGDLHTVMKHTADAESAFRTAVSLGDEEFQRFGADGHNYYGGWSSNYDNLISLLTDAGRPKEAKQLGEQRIAVLQQLADDHPETHEFRMHLASAYQDCAHWHESMGRYSDAEQLLHQGVQVLETLVTEVPEDEGVRWQLSASSLRFGNFLFGQERYADAETLFRRSVELRNKLADDYPSKSSYRARVAYTLRSLGETQLRMDKPADAEATLRESIRVASTLVSEFPENIDYVGELVQAHFELSDLLRKAGRHEEAHDELQAAMNTLNNLPADTKDRRQRDLMVNTLHRVARSLKSAGEHTEAVEILERGIGICESLVADFPAVKGFRNNLAALLDSKGLNLAESGEYSDAEAAYRTAIETYAKLVADNPRRTDYVNRLLSAHIRLASMLTDLGRDGEADIEHQRAVALRGELVGQMVGLAKQSADGVSQAVAQALAVDLANESKPFVLLACGEFSALGGSWQRAVHAIQRAIDAGGYEHWYYKSLGWALAGAGQTEEAEAAFTQALAKFDTWSPQPPENADIDHWTAAYFLDRVTQEQYTKRWRTDENYKERFACFPWFYVGQRAEIEDRIEDAIAAYETAVELGKLPNAHYAANHAAYRLQILTGKRGSVADDPNATQLAEEP